MRSATVRTGKQKPLGAHNKCPLNVMQHSAAVTAPQPACTRPGSCASHAAKLFSKRPGASTPPKKDRSQSFAADPCALLMYGMEGYGHSVPWATDQDHQDLARAVTATPAPSFPCHGRPQPDSSRTT